MKTAIELADDADLLAVDLELSWQDSNAADVRRYAAMLRQQAEQIKLLHEAMRDEMDEGLRLRELGGAKPDENITAMTERVIKENEALKADAERYRFSREKFMCYREENNDDATRRHGSELVVYAAELYIDLPRVYSTYGGVHEYTVDPEVVDAAIDAMKGKS